MKIELTKACTWYGEKYPKGWVGEVTNDVGNAQIAAKRAVQVFYVKPKSRDRNDVPENSTK
jgi:hypothetical protein